MRVLGVHCPLAVFALVLLALRPSIARGACGDGAVEPGEQCDPGSDVAGDCCDASCGFEIDGTACGPTGGTCDTGVCVTPLTLAFARVRAQSPGRANGSITLRATFATAPPADVLDASSGMRLAVHDGASLDQIVVWAPADCEATSRGGFLCIRHDVPRKIRFDPLAGSSSSWRATVRMKHLAVDGPFAPPVGARITTDGRFDRAGQAASCTATPNGALTCRAPR